MHLRALFVCWLTAVLWLAGANPTSAQVIPIASGEHEDFSRLVLYFPEAPDWTFGRVDGGFEFRSGRPDSTFALQEVFTRIPRDRIRSLRDLGDGRLFLEVDCECFGDAFDLRDGAVALDIKDGAVLPVAARFNQFLPEYRGEAEQRLATATDPNGLSSAGPDPGLPPGEQRQSAAEVAGGGDRPEALRRGLPLLFTASEQGAMLAPTSPTRPADATAQARAAEQTPGEPEAKQAPMGVAQEPGDRVAETESILLQQIARAAAQGLLVADTAKTQEIIDQIRAKSDPEQIPVPIKEPVPPAPPAIPPDPRAHVIVETVIDRENGGMVSEKEVTPNGRACPEDSAFDIASWGDMAAVGTEIGPFRSKLLQEFDAASPQAAVSLARYYIYLSFGAEAALVLNTFGPDGEVRETLLTLSQIMDNLSADQGESWRQFTGCAGKVAMWAVLANRELKPLQEVNERAITASFSELPIHLRRYLGPVLATRLIDAGKIDLAVTLRNAINRAKREGTEGTRYLDARLSSVEGETEKVIEDLQAVVSGNSTLSPQALLDLIAYKTENGIEISEGEIELLSSFEFEQRGNSTGLELRKALIIALAETAQFSEAFKRLSPEEKGLDLDAASKDTLAGIIYKNLVEKGSDAQFLRYSLAIDPALELQDETRIDLIARLVDLGFFQEARNMLSQKPEPPSPRERMLFARIAIAQEKYNVAVGYLAGLDDADALKLKAIALENQDQSGTAIETFLQAGDQKSALDLAWRVGDWELVAQMGPDPIQQAGELALKERVRLPTTAPVLAEDSNLVAQSERTREILSEILNYFE